MHNVSNSLAKEIVMFNFYISQVTHLYFVLCIVKSTIMLSPKVIFGATFAFATHENLRFPLIATVIPQTQKKTRFHENVPHILLFAR